MKVLLLRGLPQILMTHHDPFTIHRDYHDRAALFPRYRKTLSDS